ncbi:cyclohexanone monooxygenase [Fusarium beomiforme]|uniref:Cyclohexanone monooxygenase n=1 Tax=Fusarium beomiforme TaxID=44412 RepID=A0A9P5DYC5_9HYPO|nr:cyclohexanone monooxygenase [Fusarium beomiforme]
MRNLNGFLNDDPDLTSEDDIVKDGWSGSRSYSGIIGSPRTANLTEHIDNEVEDAAVAQKLKPWYPGWCKRPTFHQSYLQSFNKPNVTLVNTDGQGVQAYTEHGVRVGAGESAKEYGVDLLFLATGFELTFGADGSSARGLSIPIRGRRGRDIGEKLAAEDFGTLFGVMSHEFPNIFFYNASSASSSANLTHPIYVSARLAARIIKHATAHQDTDKIQVETQKSAEKHYTEECQKLRHWFAALQYCIPPYFLGFKQVTASADSKTSSVGWVTGTVEYEKAVEQWEHENFAGIEVSF